MALTRAITLEKNAPSNINRASPLARGLVDFWVFNEGAGVPRSLTNPGEVSVNPGGTWGINHHGRGRRYSQIPTGYDRWADSAARSITGAITVAVGFSSVIANPTDTQIFGRRSGLGSPQEEWGIFSDATLGMYFSWTNSGSFNSVYDASLGSVPAGQYTTAIGTRPVAATSGKLYKNGVLIKTTTGLNAPTAHNVPVTFGGANDGSLLFDGTINWAGLWNREFSDAEVRALHDNPYSVLAPVSPRRFFATPTAAASKAYYYAQTQGLR